MKDLIAAFNNIYSGKKFIYKSKYGCVEGIVDTVFVNNAFGLDSETEEFLIYLKNKKQGVSPISDAPTFNGIKYMGQRPEFYIKSTNGISYGFNEIYFI